MTHIILFFVATLVNVILGTLKSVITIKGGRIAASVSSAVAYGFNTLVIKMITGVETWIAVLFSVVCNLLGVYIALLITDKLRKDQLWKITVTVPVESLHEFKTDLAEKNVPFVAYETSWDKCKVVDIFSKSRAESKVVRSIVKKYDVKYTITANCGDL